MLMTPASAALIVWYEEAEALPPVLKIGEAANAAD